MKYGCFKWLKFKSKLKAHSLIQVLNKERIEKSHSSYVIDVNLLKQDHVGASINHKLVSTKTIVGLCKAQRILTLHLHELLRFSANFLSQIKHLAVLENAVAEAAHATKLTSIKVLVGKQSFARETVDVGTNMKKTQKYSENVRK